MAGSMYSTESPAGKILDYLRRHGEATVKDLEELMGISTTAVREHLTHLQAKDLVTTRLVRNGPGRPHAVYSLTAEAHNLFPKEYDTLTNMLLREIASQDGPARLQGLLDAVGARLAEEYGVQVTGEGIDERLAALRVALERRGIPVEIQPPGDSFRLFACPYFDVMQEHAGVCAMERRMVEQVLGEQIVLEGTIREGRRSCHFTVVQEPGVRHQEPRAKSQESELKLLTPES